jgi:hypothetical protein
MWLPPALRASTTDEGLVLLNVETGDIYTANAVGGRIWSLLEEGQNESEIAAHIARVYDRPEAAIAADVHEFIDGLIALGARPVL